ncbi:MAG: rhomboid family intramembrane serine protease [Bryobacteraceae bacterium]
MIPLRDSQPSHATPFITMGLIFINVMIFLYQVSLDPYSLHHLIMEYGVVPDRLRPVTLVTSMFLHGGWLHLIGNMWFLWIFGDNIEDILGHWKFVGFYVGCGVLASLGHVLVHPDSRIPAIGASGAIAGVMGAYILKFPHSRIVTLIPIFFFITTVNIPAYVILLYWFVLQLFSGIGAVVAAQDAAGVAWFAHIGGFIAGMILIFLLPTKSRYSHRADFHW